MTETKQDKERYTRESFSWRRMTARQLRAVSIFAAVAVVALLVYVLV